MSGNWIDRLWDERNALKSSVVFVETNDPKRMQEFLDHYAFKLSHKHRVGKGQERTPPLVIYDGFAGISRYVEDGEGNYIEEAVESKGSLLGDATLQTLSGLLETDDDGKADQIVVIRNILKKEDFPGKWPNAINHWATSDKVMGQRNTVIIFAPSRDVLLGVVLKKLIHITPPVSEAEEREEILKFCASEVEVELDEARVEELVQLTSGLDLAEAEAVFSEAVLKVAKGGELDIGLVARTKSAIINKSKSLRVQVEGGQGFESVGGYEVVKDWVRESIIEPMRDPERAERLGMEPPKGVVFFGPPGTGKTIFARALAKELNMPFVELNPEAYMESLLGESERNLKASFDLIDAMSPVVVFIDEMDRLGSRSSGQTENETNRRLQNMYLSWMSSKNRKAIVVGATNLPESLDAAMIREGRIDVMIPLMSPDADARYEILLVHLNVVRSVAHNLTEGQLREIAAETTYWKGNMLEELVKRAARMAFNRGSDVVEYEDMKEALADYRPKEDELKAEEERYAELAERMTNSKKFLDNIKRGGRAEPKAKGRRGQLREAVKE